MSTDSRTSFEYYERFISRKPAPKDAALHEAIRAALARYWELVRANKLPPLSAADRDEALDRIIALLPELISKYDAERGAKLSTYVGRVLERKWLVIAHRVAREAQRLETGVFDGQDAADDAAVAGLEEPEDGAAELVYADPPESLGDPFDEVAEIQLRARIQTAANDDCFKGELDAARRGRERARRGMRRLRARSD